MPQNPSAELSPGSPPPHAASSRYFPSRSSKSIAAQRKSIPVANYADGLYKVKI